MGRKLRRKKRPNLPLFFGIFVLLAILLYFYLPLLPITAHVVNVSTQTSEVISLSELTLNSSGTNLPVISSPVGTDEISLSQTTTPEYVTPADQWAEAVLFSCITTNSA